MSFLTTNPNPLILNLPSFQNVANSANGVSAQVSFLNTKTASLQINTIGTYQNASFLSITNNVNLVNSSLYINGTNTVNENSFNGTSYVALQVNSQEQARVTSAGFGINTNAPTKTLDVNGDAILRGNVHISNANTGNLYVDGKVFANSIYYTSDPSLKQNIRPYTNQKLPDAVTFEWKSTGLRDIGVLASDVQEIEPLCVHILPDGTRTVDYPKLVVLCLAELKSLQSTVKELTVKLEILTSERSESLQ